MALAVSFRSFVWRVRIYHQPATGTFRQGFSSGSQQVVSRSFMRNFQHSHTCIHQTSQKCLGKLVTAGCVTLPKFNKLPKPNRKVIVFQPPFFRGKLAVKLRLARRHRVQLGSRTFGSLCHTGIRVVKQKTHPQEPTTKPAKFRYILGPPKKIWFTVGKESNEFVLWGEPY